MSRKERFRDRISRFFNRDQLQEESAEGPSDAVCINEALPNELLAAIFAFNAERNFSAFKAVLSISHTCSLWRDVAIGCPELWRSYAFLQTVHKDFSEAILKRCGDLTLDAGWDRVDGIGVASIYRTEPLLDNFHRLRSYHLLFNDMVVHLAQPGGLYISPALSLQTLVLDSGNLFKYTPVHYQLVDPATPSLRILRLRSVWFDISSLQVDNIHTIDIALPSDAKPHTTQQWLSFIQSCPKLAHLSLNLYGELGSDEPRNTSRSSVKHRFPLPFLSRLVLAAPLPFCCTLLRRFAFPSLRALGVTWPEREIDGEIHSIVSRIMVPLMTGAAANSKDNRMQISVSDGANKLYIGFTPGNVDLLPPEDWSEFAGEHFGAVDSHPTDYFQLRIKSGAWRLGKLLPYWTPVARLLSMLHIDVSRNDAIDSSSILNFFMSAPTDSYILWDYLF